MPQWGPDGDSPAFPYLSGSSSSESIHGQDNYNGFGHQHSLQLAVDGSVRMTTAEVRDNMEFGDLLVPSTMPQDSSSETLAGLSFTNEQRYLGAYWTWLHDIYPLVHKPTFNLDAASPLLRASMLALGAHMLQNSTDMDNARIIHERCAKILKRRDVDGSHTFRICDMQAIVLNEIYFLFGARRPPLHFSKTFVELYRMLASDTEVFGYDSVSPPPNTHTVHVGDLVDEPWDSGFSNMDAKCKQRLLFVCYMLDQQHATLFGRQRTICVPMLGLTLPFPRPQFVWDAPHEHRAEIHFQRQSDLPIYDRVFQAVGDVPSMTEVSQGPHDAFQSSLIMACLVDPSNDLQTCGFTADDGVDLSPILYAVEQSPRMRLTYHTFMLCKHSPVRDLLAVAGESWCMAEKLSSQADYTASQIEARAWAQGAADCCIDTGVDDQETPVQRALCHARQIIDIHRSHPKTGLLFQEWSVYLAAVVFWARAYVVEREPGRKPRLSIPSPAEPKLSSHELERDIAAVIDGGAVTLGWKETKSVLLWVKLRIERVDMPHNCGLTNGALDVLGKLATRGNEDGWFGA